MGCGGVGAALVNFAVSVGRMVSFRGPVAAQLTPHAANINRSTNVLLLITDSLYIAAYSLKPLLSITSLVVQCMDHTSSNPNSDQTPRHPPGGNAFAVSPRPLSRLSSYTLKSMHRRTDSGDSSNEASSLLNGRGKGKLAADGAAEGVRRYGTVSASSEDDAINAREARKKLLWAGVKMAILFVVCTIALWGTLKVALPTVEE